MPGRLLRFWWAPRQPATTTSSRPTKGPTGARAVYTQLRFLSREPIGKHFPAKGCKIEGCGQTGSHSRLQPMERGAHRPAEPVGRQSNKRHGGRKDTPEQHHNRKGASPRCELQNTHPHLFAVFAVSAVASASASAASCYKVNEAGTGNYKKANAITGLCEEGPVAGREYIEVEKVETDLGSGVLCAKVKEAGRQLATSRQ